jgi:8-oxo-dGTP diphosphatase
VPIGGGHVLTAAVVRLVSGEPEPTEHDAVRWLGADELGDVDWLEPDRPFLAPVARWLAGDRASPSAQAGEM